MSMTRLAALSLTCLIGLAATAAPPKVAHYSDKACSLSFDYPAGWVVEKEKGKEDDECTFSVSPRNLDQRLKDDDVDVWTFSIHVELENFLDAAGEAGFEFVHGKWALGGFDDINGPAAPFEMPPWWGVRGVSDVRTYHPQGGNAGFRQRLAIVAQSGTLREGDPRIVTINGYVQSTKTIDRVLRSLRFQMAD